MYQRTLDVEPDNSNAHLAVAITLIGAEQYSDAIDHLLLAYRNVKELVVREIILMGKDMLDISTEAASKVNDFYVEAKNRGFLMDIYQRPFGVLDFAVVSKPWWNSKEIRFVDLLESNFEVIKNELLDIMQDTWGQVGTRKGNAYDIQLVTGAPSAQWKEFVFYDKGLVNKENLEKCPKTAAVLHQLPEALSCILGQVHFSLLTPGTRLKPHCGGTNYRLTAHLGMIIPRGDVGIKVGEKKKKWREGKVLIFDDSYEHEVWNNSEFDRVVLLINFWHPTLSGERVTQIVDDTINGKFDTFDPHQG